MDELSKGRVKREAVHTRPVERKHQLGRGPVHAVPGNLQVGSRSVLGFAFRETNTDHSVPGLFNKMVREFTLGFGCRNGAENILRSIQEVSHVRSTIWEDSSSACSISQQRVRMRRVSDCNFGDRSSFDQRE